MTQTSCLPVPVRVDAPPIVRGRLISIIVPTLREAANLPGLIQRLEQLDLSPWGGAELILIDDNSRDGTEQVVTTLGREWVRLIVRRDERGLSSAVIAGFRAARGDTLVVMDADLSHPPESIPALLRALDHGADFALGSRYIEGGSTDAAWTFARRVNSRLATLMARPFTSARDPMSGFFALRRSTFDRGTSIRPIGYKIGLELLVKCGCTQVAEVPIHFSERRLGQSKLSAAEQWRYLRHVARLALYKAGCH